LWPALLVTHYVLIAPMEWNPRSMSAARCHLGRINRSGTTPDRTHHTDHGKAEPIAALVVRHLRCSQPRLALAIESVREIKTRITGRRHSRLDSCGGDCHQGVSVPVR
jgi:hypothetical protein